MNTRTDARRRQNAVPVASFVVAGIFAVAFAVLATGRSTDAGAGAAAWEGVAIDAMELEAHTSLADITASADAVVRGRVVAVTEGRAFGEPDGTQLHYAAATVRVDEVLAGEQRLADAAALTLEIPLFDGPDQLAELQQGLPWAESIFFLRHKAESARDAGMSREAQLAETGFYRLVTMRSVIVNEGGRAVALADAPAFLAAMDGLDFGEVTMAVRHGGG
jgi:hypothetical protein